MIEPRRQPGVESAPVFTGIPPDRVEEFWGRISTILWRAIIRTEGRHTLLTTKHAIQDSRMQLWAAFDGPDMETCIAVLVTETAQFPSGHISGEIVFAAGEIIPDCLPLLGLVESWAKSVGCSSLRLIGRKGWSRALKTMGYEETAILMEKAL